MNSVQRSAVQKQWKHAVISVQHSAEEKKYRVTQYSVDEKSTTAQERTAGQRSTTLEEKYSEGIVLNEGEKYNVTRGEQWGSVFRGCGWNR